MTASVTSDVPSTPPASAVDSRWNRTEDPLWGGGSMWNSGGPGSGGGAGAHVPKATASGGDGYSFGGFGGMIGHAKLLGAAPRHAPRRYYTSLRVGVQERCGRQRIRASKRRTAHRNGDVQGRSAVHVALEPRRLCQTCSA